ncbi:microfibril-associated/Pre-mRNA processing domain-containing protein [Hirsutella rhossiliensis]|uniref:Microfibril-associated/Pre-mRNA processing domain-containing protein n=1 Tax=Hirsutella rhossiliensis TaxID=111463 RepID=A0A9P8SJQ6_9HYPO|nr:microfibril-associated/Pre-mRNA processing domain-containing protein [Hirsutella rhossiliensis]KAH0965161.1 microfibril-associated/Pre-mRNA processing domain-containing protein [Hirsutella rhossiliensis]
MPPSRMTANPARPARHRAGKPTGNVSSSDSDSDDAEAPPPPPTIPAPPKAASAGKIISNLNRIDLNARRQELEKGFVTEGEEEESEAEESESGEESDEEESSEEEEPRRLMMRPKFVPKSQRGQTVKDPEQEEEAVRQAEEEARKKAADELVEEQIKKDLEARAAGKKHWDDEDNQDSDVDTTDGLDPEAEEAAWRVRELKRLKRARAAIEERERELAEVERRRNLTAEERAAEDEAHLAKQREDKEGKGKMSYMQKYYHKGAFFQDETETAGLLQRDIMGSRFQDDVRNREALPEYLQKRDMTKLGRKGATKYKDMRTEDTGRWGQFDDSGPRGHRDRFDGDDRFRPDDARFRQDDGGPKGANAVPLRERRGKHAGDDDDGHQRRSRSRSPRDRDDDKRRKVDVDVRR